MNSQSKKQSIAKKIMERIKRGKVKMKPKAYFILRNALLVVGIVVVSAAALYFTSFIFFVTRRAGLWFLPRYGVRGIRLLLGGFPWGLLLAVVLFIVLLELLAKRHRIVYRKPLLYSALAIIFFVVVTALVIQQTPFHGRIYRQVQEGHMRLARPLYGRFEMPQPDKIHPGIVSEVTASGFIIERQDGEILEVKVSPQTRLPREGEIQKGDRIVVIGELKDGVVQALGAHKVPDGVDRFPPPPRRPGPIRPGFK